MPDTERLRSIASAAREGFERRQVPREEISRLYLAYNDVADIEGFLDQAERLFPSLNCGLASVYLRRKMEAAGFDEVEIAQGRYREHDHTFLIVGGEIVVDITADQYGGPRVFVGKLAPPWSVVRRNA